MSYPDSPTANVRVITVGLEPAPGGTRVRVRMGWEPTSGPGSIHRLIAR